MYQLRTRIKFNFSASRSTSNMEDVHLSDHVIMSYIGLPADFHGSIYGAIGSRYSIKIQNSFIDFDVVR